ncbi:MAG: tetratricopeptide repeat protein [Planctomycetota bacterium]
MTAPAPSRPARPSPRTLALLIAAGVLVAYVPAMGAGYIWDDDSYLTENPLVRTFGGLLRMWVPGATPQYYPAVFTMFWFEHALWGLHPAGYHVVNILLHAANALLVWRLCTMLRIPGAWFVGAVFALHPVHVESVAWITERKNVLSGLFYLLAALTYLRFDDAADGPRRPWWTYAVAMLLFVAALLAKTVTCSLPAALVLVMLWQRKALTLRRLLPLAPFFVVGLVLALHTAHLERVNVGAEGVDFDLSWAERLLIASKALPFYAQKLVLPWPLIFVYPRWQLDASSVRSFAPLLGLLLVAIAAIVAFARGRRGPALALAFFAGTLFPALGFFDVYPMRYSFVADHFQYLASLGPLALLVGAAASLSWHRSVLRVAVVFVLGLFAILTWRQCGMYADQETLWKVTLERNPGAWMAQNNLAKAASKRGDHAEALRRLEAALPLTDSPKAADQIRANQALVLTKLGRYAESLQLYRDVERSNGGMAVKIAQTLDRLGQRDEAERAYLDALAGGLREEALLPYALHLLSRDRFAPAVPVLEEVVGLQPGNLFARTALADALGASGRHEDAIRALERALAVAQAARDAQGVAEVRRRLDAARRR